jgi:hypothetical protein
VQVLREGVTLRNPFRFAFEPWQPPSAPVAQELTPPHAEDLEMQVEDAREAAAEAAQAASVLPPPAAQPADESGAAGAGLGAGADDDAEGTGAGGAGPALAGAGLTASGRPKRERSATVRASAAGGAGASAAHADAAHAGAPLPRRRRGAAAVVPVEASAAPQTETDAQRALAPAAADAAAGLASVPTALARAAAAARRVAAAAVDVGAAAAAARLALGPAGALGFFPPPADLRPAPLPRVADAVGAGGASGAGGAGRVAGAVATPPPPALQPALAPRVVTPLEGTDLAAVVKRLTDDCKCPICHDLLAVPHGLACSHSFCGVCIVTWLKKRNACPCCRARPGAARYDRLLDEMLCAIVEPGPDEAEAAERASRKLEWEAMKLALAREAREDAAARQARALAAAPGAGVAPRGAAGGAFAAAAAGAAADPGVITWRVGYVPAGPRFVCHTCFHCIAAGELRTIREAPPPPWADLLAGALPPTQLRAFHHTACRVPSCPPAEVQDMDTLREEDRARMIALMGQAAVPPAALAGAPAAVALLAPPQAM